MPETLTADPKPFDPAAYIKQRNEAEEARRLGKPIATPEAEPPKPKPQVPAVEPDEDEDDDEPESATAKEPKVNSSRSSRRALNRAHEEIGKERAQREMLEKRLTELEAKLTPRQEQRIADTDPQPEQSAYADVGAFNQALIRWLARQETKQALSERDQMSAKERETSQISEELRALDAKAAKDMEQFEDWDEVANSDDATQVSFVPDEHKTFITLLASSDLRAAMNYHLAKNPSELQGLLDMGEDPKIIKAFHRLEGKVERLYAKTDPAEKKPAKEPVKTAAERDIQKARPSQALAPKGGSAPEQDVKPTLDDGVTMNPAWLEQRNQRAGRRR